MVDLQGGVAYHQTIAKGIASVAKTATRLLGKKEVVVDLRKVKELQRLLKAATEGEAVRMAIDESVANLRMSRSLNRFWDALAK